LRGILNFTLVALLTTLFLNCAPARKDYTIKYPAYLIAEHPKSFWECYVKVIGVLEERRLQDQVPPLSGKDLVICDKTGCVYVHSDIFDLSDYIGKRVKVLGFVEVSRFNTAYIDVLEIKVLNENR